MTANRANLNLFAADGAVAAFAFGHYPFIVVSERADRFSFRSWFSGFGVKAAVAKAVPFECSAVCAIRVLACELPLAPLVTERTSGGNSCVGFFAALAFANGGSSSVVYAVCAVFNKFIISEPMSESRADIGDIFLLVFAAVSANAVLCSVFGAGCVVVGDPVKDTVCKLGVRVGNGFLCNVANGAIRTHCSALFAG